MGKAELVLYEVGGGTGTNALHVLNWLCREDPELYDRTEYTIVEISERLAERQREKVCAVHKVRDPREVEERKKKRWTDRQIRKEAYQ